MLLVLGLRTRMLHHHKRFSSKDPHARRYFFEQTDVHAPGVPAVPPTRRPNSSGSARPLTRRRPRRGHALLLRSSFIEQCCTASCFGSGSGRAVAADSEVDPLHDDTLTPAQHPEPLGDPDQRDTFASEVEDLEDTITITTLTNTTSLHDDWLHRGPFLVDLDLHTYVAHVIRSPRPVKAQLDDAQRIEHVFAFDDHYELAKSH